MKSAKNPWSRMVANWKVTALLALPIFSIAMWFGIARGYDDLWLFGLAMALASLHVADAMMMAFNAWHRWRLRG